MFSRSSNNWTTKKVILIRYRRSTWNAVASARCATAMRPRCMKTLCTMYTPLLALGGRFWWATNVCLNAMGAYMPYMLSNVFFSVHDFQFYTTDYPAVRRQRKLRLYPPNNVNMARHYRYFSSFGEEENQQTIFRGGNGEALEAQKCPFNSK